MTLLVLSAELLQLRVFRLGQAAKIQNREATGETPFVALRRFEGNDRCLWMFSTDIARR
jgi:hypothetical protein